MTYREPKIRLCVSSLAARTICTRKLSDNRVLRLLTAENQLRRTSTFPLHPCNTIPIAIRCRKLQIYHSKIEENLLVNIDDGYSVVLQQHIPSQTTRTATKSFTTIHSWHIELWNSCRALEMCWRQFFGGHLHNIRSSSSGWNRTSKTLLGTITAALYLGKPPPTKSFHCARYLWRFERTTRLFRRVKI